MTVPIPAELAARLTLARAIAADYAREARGDGGCRPDWYSWAARLHTALVGILAALEALASGPGITGGRAPIALADVATVRAALSDAIDYRADGRGACADCEASLDGLCDDHGADRDLTGRYKALVRALGGDL